MPCIAIIVTSSKFHETQGVEPCVELELNLRESDLEPGLLILLILHENDLKRKERCLDGNSLKLSLVEAVAGEQSSEITRPIK